MGFFDSVGDTIQLTKNTFALAAQSPDILKPTFAQIKISLLLLFLIIVSALGILFADGAMQSAAFIALVAFILAGWILFPFIRMYYRAAQCWLVYNSFTGKPVSYQEGLKRAGQNKKDIIVLTIIDIIMNFVAGSLKKGTGRGGLWVIANIVLWFLGRVLEEVWDLVGHFLLPASIIQEKSVKEVLPELKNIKNNATGALAGVLGFDFAGDIARGYITAVLILFALAGFALGMYFNNWYLFLLIVLVIIVVNMIAKTLVDTTKTIYFTLFYIAVTMPMKIKPEYTNQVTHYLLHQSQQPTQSQETEEEKVAKLLPFIKQYRQQGYTDSEIISFLAKNNWPEQAVKKALKKRG